MISLSHVAVLVPSAQKAADYLKKFDFVIGPSEDWDGEGTREIYVEKDKANSLLLMEPIKEGSYKRALEKRGPSLHHLAIDVLNLEEFLSSISNSGWLLHLNSLKTIKQMGTAYLARPGFPALIEVQEKKELQRGLPFVNKISLQFDSALEKLLKPIGYEQVIENQKFFLLKLNEQQILFKDLL